MTISRASGTPCGSVFGRFGVLSYDHSDAEVQMKVSYASVCYGGQHNPAFILVAGECVFVYYPMASMETDQSRQNYENRPKWKKSPCKIELATQ